MSLPTSFSFKPRGRKRRFRPDDEVTSQKSQRCESLEWKVQTKLRDAVFSGDAETLKTIIKMHDLSGRQIDECRFPGDRGLLEEAVKLQLVDVVDVLLYEGCDVNFTCMDSKSPLHQAVRHNNMDMTKILLIHGADPNLLGGGQLPLHIALWKHNKLLFNLLLSHGASVTKCDSDGWSALHWVAHELDVDLCRELILGSQCNLNHQNKSGKTALHIALSYVCSDEDRDACFSILTLLIHHGLDLNLHSPQCGTTLEQLVKSKLWNEALARCASGKERANRTRHCFIIDLTRPNPASKVACAQHDSPTRERLLWRTLDSDASG